MSLTPIEETDTTPSADTSKQDVDPPTFSRLPIPWAQYWDECIQLELSPQDTFQVYRAGESGPVLFLVHGGGYTALTWSLLAMRMKKEYQIFAMDIRGHGGTSTQDQTNLSIEVLINDLKSVLLELKSRYSSVAESVVLVGHSMGGAVVVKAASADVITSIKGVVVIDVVEGTALASLPFMKNVINKRPTSFQDLGSAVEWALNTKMSKNKEAAHISIPSMLISTSEGWKWRTPLLTSEPYWKEWYTGLSDLFLNLPTPKLLCLAGTDRLDKTLTIGQMQGKFQLSLLPTAGHAIHEDDPDQVSTMLTQFIKKFRIGKTPLPFLRH